MQKASGREVGKILLLFGCRTPDNDYLYSDHELAIWTKLGVVDVRPDSHLALHGATFLVPNSGRFANGIPSISIFYIFITTSIPKLQRAALSGSSQNVTFCPSCWPT